MKKYLVMALAALALTGCGEAAYVKDTYNSDIVAIRDTLNDKETELINKWGNGHKYKAYYKVWQQVMKVRKEYGQPDKRRSNSLAPFCDVIDSLVAQEAGFTKGTPSISYYWQREYGITLVEQCAKEVPPLTTKKAEQLERATVVVDNVVLLDLEQIKQLREAVQDCGRAKNRLLDILGGNEDLTIEHYNEVTKLTLQCERFKLERDLNN